MTWEHLVIPDGEGPYPHSEVATFDVLGATVTIGEKRQEGRAE